ncbi:four-carbon acid sugar kinase family protein [uncultured Megasphaera sp.]|uniref:four-carbon acid sugar kinase family protein n=1 Tax=uncultured Megasphaera sp. TaxID=165188 RepID=UPI0025937330|nr:four-carbon acid sugar kinase family protein [uncultured Megasphaera sp.]
MAKVLKAELFQSLPKVQVDEEKISQELLKELKEFNKKIVVLDDDPTGTQTVHDISVYTEWTEDTLTQGFNEENSEFYVLTNSRAFTQDYTRQVHTDIAKRVSDVAKATGKDFIIISRSDSTLRGHYPLETKTLKETLEANGAPVIDGEVLMPFFKEGGRFTIGNVHYVQEGEYLVPANETEFAQDSTFGYKAATMPEYIEEKTGGAFKADSVTCISLEDLRAGNVDAIAQQLVAVHDFNKVIVNCTDYIDVKVFALALLKAMREGRHFMFRSAAALTKVLGGVSDKELLTKDELVVKGNTNGGLIIIGSHVKKTTQQLEKLQELDSIEFIEFNHLMVLESDEKLEAEIERVIKKTEDNIKHGVTTAVMTGRKLLKMDTKEDSLRVSVKISDALVQIVNRLTIQPKFIISKGGITSSDVATKGLHIKKALVLGQVAPGIPAWKAGSESKFPGMSYVVFPGNVGEVTTLRDVVAMMNA